MKKKKKIKIEEGYSVENSRITYQTINLIQEVVFKEMNVRGDLYTHDKFFKEIPTNNILKTHILQKI